MPSEDIFDEMYVGGQDQTPEAPKKSELKAFLKEPLEEEELERYGSSKPKRVVIRAKITNG